MTAASVIRPNWTCPLNDKTDIPIEISPAWGTQNITWEIGAPAK